MARLAPFALLLLLAAFPAILGCRRSPAQFVARSISENNLKSIGQGVRNYEATNRYLPCGVAGPDRKVGLSWRVAILPFIEEEKLYKEFKLDEPWDSENNKKLIAKMPEIYAPPRGAKAKVANGLTYYRSFSGGGALAVASAGREPGMLMHASLSAISDGGSRTAMIAEAADPVIWTKPDELEYDAKKPTPKLGGVFEDGAFVVMCDTYVLFLSSKIDDKVLRAIITRAGKEDEIELP